MDAQLIMEMENKKTRLLKPRLQSIRDAGRDNHHDFTFDYSYWSFDAEDPHFATQEQVYSDLGNDVVDCAYEGEPRSKGSRHSITQLWRINPQLIERALVYGLSFWGRHPHEKCTERV